MKRKIFLDLISKILQPGGAKGQGAIRWWQRQRVVKYFMNEQEIRNSLFFKSFMISGLEGWYLEFGCYAGYSFNIAYKSAKLIIDDFTRGAWDAGIGREQNKEQIMDNFNNIWNNMKFVAFDSFEGIPFEQSDVDKHYEVFQGGSYSCSQDQFITNLKDSFIDMDKVTIVPGWFDKTLNKNTADQIGLKEIAVAHIDSDLYKSAKAALDFCTPYFRDGSIVIFDEWFQFRGNPYLGEQRALSEWRVENPKWTVSEYATSGIWSKAFILSLKPDFI